MKQINVIELKEKLETQSDDLTVDFVSVCTPEEYNAEHVAGIRNVPLSEIPLHIDEFKNKKTIYFQCKSGVRSSHAIQLLQDLGITAELINIEGGILAWIAAGFDTVQNKH
jgi:rhodanese-related sulfurtransferase